MDSQEWRNQRRTNSDAEVLEEIPRWTTEDGQTVESQEERSLQLLQQSMNRMRETLEERRAQRRTSGDGGILEGHQHEAEEENRTEQALQLLLQNFNSRTWPNGAHGEFNEASFLGTFDNDARMSYNRVMIEQAKQVSDIMTTLEHQVELTHELARSNVELQENLLGAQMAHEESLREQRLLMERGLEVANKIKRSIDAVFSKKYKYRESRAPRLFIVLPELEETGARPGLKLSGRYRLFYLCECGKHTMRGRDDEHHRVHLADHEGYSIKMTASCFREFGPYILTMLQMLKHGYNSKDNGIEVLPLEMMEPVDKQSIRRYLKLPGSATVKNAVDMMIAVLKNKLNTDDDHGINPNSTIYLEFGHLKNFLENHHSPAAHNEGHHGTNLRGLEKQQERSKSLEIIQRDGNGTYYPERGRIKYTAKGKSGMKDFIKAFSTTHGVHDLFLSLDYNVPYGEIKSSAKAILKSKVVHSLCREGLHDWAVNQTARIAW
ncbi:hypothetical protein BGZ76_002039 [Entomortierella beljakovae]|nr:hypothetical protein BGZ76_002039 [Entomortierella beljakovae]